MSAASHKQDQERVKELDKHGLLPYIPKAFCGMLINEQFDCVAFALCDAQRI